MQRTIRLPESFALTADGTIKGWSLYIGDQVLDQCKVGAKAVLGSRTDVSPDSIRAGRDVPKYFLEFDLEGILGNGNPAKRCQTGWRGTTNDISVHAHGVCTIRKIRALRDGTVAVTVTVD